MELEPAAKGIRDEEISESSPLVRALVVQRLEQMWTVCEPHVKGQVARPDPRILELGVRVLDRLIRLYRLDQPVAGERDPSAEELDRAAMVLRDLEQIEARINGSSL